MDLLTGARTVIAATVHLDKSGRSKMVGRCSLPLTAACEVDYVVTDVGLFALVEERFVLNEYFAPATPEWIVRETQADVFIAADCREYRF